MLIRSTGENAYFAAANSAEGFVCDYSACFDSARIGRLYAVKGGPGTGKSRFLRDVANYAREKGFDCEYVYCSSDPDSLDGVILEKGGRGIALLDATAPHVYEPRLPGAREELVNLGVFWDGELLEQQRRQIEALQEQKSRAYRRAYRYLAAAGALAEARDLLVEPYLRAGAIRDLAESLMDGIESDGVFSEQVARMGSIGMQGRVYLDTYLTRASEIVVLQDCRGIAWRLLAEMREIARSRKFAICSSCDPLIPTRLDAISCLSSGRTFAVLPRGTCPCPHRTVSVRRLLRAEEMGEVRRECNTLSRSVRAAMGSAVGALRDVRRAHFSLEEIYSATMNFTAKENFTKIFCRELFASLDP